MDQVGRHVRAHAHARPSRRPAALVMGALPGHETESVRAASRGDKGGQPNSARATVGRMAAPVRKERRSSPDRFARVRRKRRRAARRVRRLRARRPARRPRPRARDEGQARLRGGDPRRAARARPGSRRGAVPALRRLRRLPVPGPRLRGQLAAKESQVRDALIRLGGFESRRRADRAGAVGLATEQARVLVRGHAGRARPRVPPGGPLGRGDRRGGVPPHDGRRERDPRGRQGVGARGGASAVRPGDPDGLRRHLVVREGATPARCSSCSSPPRASASTPTS